jgi:hypothetical protein
MCTHSPIHGVYTTEPTSLLQYSAVWSMSSAVLHKRLLLLASKPELQDYRSKLQTLGNAIGFGEMIPMINAYIYSRAKDLRNLFS